MAGLSNSRCEYCLTSTTLLKFGFGQRLHGKAGRLQVEEQGRKAVKTAEWAKTPSVRSVVMREKWTVDVKLAQRVMSAGSRGQGSVCLPVREVFVEARSPGRLGQARPGKGRGEGGKGRCAGRLEGGKVGGSPSPRPSACLLIDSSPRPCFSRCFSWEESVFTRNLLRHRPKEERGKG